MVLEQLFARLPSTIILIVLMPLLPSPAVAVSVTDVPGVSEPLGLRLMETEGAVLSAESVVVRTVERAFALSSMKQ